MKILTTQINKFVSEDFKKFNAILIYGPDYNLVSERCEQIIANNIKPTDKINLHLNKVTFKYKDISNDPYILENEILSLNFFTKSKIIIIDEVDGNFPKAIGEILEKNQDNIIIFKAQDLPSTSSIRKSFEKEKNLASLACYENNTLSTKQQILKLLSESNLVLEDPSIANILAETIPGNQTSINSEINKIILYYNNRDNKKITVPNKIINQLLSNNQLNIDYDSLLNSFVNQDDINIETIIEKMIRNGENMVSISRYLSHFIIKALKIKTLMLQPKNRSIDIIIKEFSPPIFFKHVPILKKTLNKYSIPALLELLEKLTIIEKEHKNFSGSTDILSHLLIN